MLCSLSRRSECSPWLKTSPFYDQSAGAISPAGLARSQRRVADREAYPFCLPFLRHEFELEFDRPITIIAGENGTGKIHAARRHRGALGL